MTGRNSALEPSWTVRLWSRNAAILLGRNTIVSSGAFLFGLIVMGLMVEIGHLDKILATALSFLIATSLHYLLGRVWIYRGTSRGVAPGYAYFLINAGLGLAVTVVLFGALVQYTEIHYLLARVLVSVVAGLMMFLLNSTLNFRRL